MVVDMLFIGMGADDKGMLPEQYASGSGHYAGCGRGAPDRPAVWFGFQCAGEYEQRDLLHQLGGESDPESHESKASVREEMK